MLPASTRDHRWIPRHTDGEVLQLHGRGGPLIKRRTANLRCGSFLDWFRLPRQSPTTERVPRSPRPSAFLVFTTPPGSRNSRVGYRHSLKTCDADCPDRADEADADTARRAGKRSMAIQVGDTRPVAGFDCSRRPPQVIRVPGCVSALIRTFLTSSTRSVEVSFDFSAVPAFPAVKDLYRMLTR